MWFWKQKKELATVATNPWNSDIPFNYASMWIGAKECLKSIQQRTSNDNSLHWLPYSVKKYMGPAMDPLKAAKPLDQYRCLILGSNEGWMERMLCESGFKGEIIASDIADKALHRAADAAKERGFTNIRHVLADLNTAQFEGPFDFIVAEGVLHHIVNIEQCLRMLESCLTADGYVFAVEFEGPVRFQLSDLQVQWINAALGVLPRGLRPLPVDSRAFYPATPAENLRIKYHPPTEESIAAFDPSEAICGPMLKQLIPKVFEVVERNPFGGTLLSYMTQHFDFERSNVDDFSRAWLKILMELEQTLISTGILEDEFVFYVLGRHKTAPAIPLRS